MVSPMSSDDNRSPVEALPPPDSAAHRSSFARWRGPLSTLLLVLFMVTAGLAVPAVWARNQVLDTDRFVRTVSPLGDDEAFQEAVANRVTNAVTQGVASTDLVSENDGVVAALLPAVTNAAVDSVTHSFVSSPDFPAVWDDTARIAHSGFVALLEGTDSPLFDSASGQVSVDLTPVVQAVIDELNARGISLSMPSGDMTFVVFESSRLADLQSVTSRLEDLAIILTLAALASLLAYVLVAPNWRGAIVVAGLGLAISMLVVLLFVALLRWLYLDSLSATVDRDAALNLFDTLTFYLRSGLRILGLSALAIAGIAFLVFRRRISFGAEEEAHRSLYARWPAIGKFENAVATNRLASVAIWASLICAVLFVVEWTDFGWVIVMLVSGVAGLLLIFRAKPVPIELLSPPAAAGTPDSVDRASVGLDLQRVADLKVEGMLSDEEFAQAKSLILAGS